MTQVLTERAVLSAKPNPDKRLEIPDGMLPGFYLVVQPKGAKSWAVRYRYAGRTKKFTIGGYPAFSLKDARNKARKALQIVAEGNDPAQKKRDKQQRDLIDDVIADFLKRHASKNRSAKETNRIFTVEVLPKWRGRKIHDISRRDVIELLDGIADRPAPIMANRTLAAVRKMFNWALSRDIIESTPTQGVKPPGKEQSRDRYLSDDEIRWFWKATERQGSPFGPLFRLLLLTGQRLDEVAAMTESEIHDDLWTIPAKRAKNDRRHPVPLSRVALDTLDAIPRVESDAGFIFTTNGTTHVSGYSVAKKRLDKLMLDVAQNESPIATIPHWTLHDLRRTVSSNMARLGVNLQVAEKALNHVSGSFGGIVGVYNQHTYFSEITEAFDLWNQFIVAQASDNITEKNAEYAQ